MVYTVEVTNRFKGLDLIDRGHEELWMKVHDIVQEAVIKTIPKKKKCKRQNGCLRRPYKQQRKCRSVEYALYKTLKRQCEVYSPSILIRQMLDLLKWSHSS